MPVEGISMTTVFSLVTVGLALSLSVFIGGSYLQPSFDISKIITGVAYDLSTLYDIAYTMPGEVTMRYFGPSACEWNRNQNPDSFSSFHCFSGNAVVISDVFVSKELLYVYNDPYMKYDYNKCISRGELCLPPDSFTASRPAYGFVGIPFFNAQLCAYTDTLQSCDYAFAPFAASYKDYSFLTESRQTITVEDYSFIVKKENIGGYYESVAQSPENPTSLLTFIYAFNDFYNRACLDNAVLINAKETWRNENVVSDNPSSFFLREGYRWHVYENGKGDNTVICQERLILNGTDGGIKYISVEGLTMLLDNYVVDYCFDISTIVERKPCLNVPAVEISDDAIALFNTGYTYYASTVSCLKPYFEYTGSKLLINAVGAEYNTFSGECERV